MSNPLVEGDGAGASGTGAAGAGSVPGGGGAAAGNGGGASGGSAAAGMGDLAWAGDQDATTFVTGKGWKQPAEVVRSYRELEKMVRGGDASRLASIPAEDDDKGWQEFYGKLGRPEKPDDYDFKSLDLPADDPVLGKFKEWVHGAGLSKKQALAIAKEYVSFTQAAEKEMHESMERETALGIERMKKDWGQLFDEHVVDAKRFIRMNGLTNEDVESISGVWGIEKVTRLFSKLGKGMSEHNAGAGGEGSTGITPSSAQMQIARLKEDADFVKRYLDKDPAAFKKMTELMAIAYPT